MKNPDQASPSPERGVPDIGGIRDTLLGTPLEAVRRKWESILKGEAGPFLQFYVACPDDQLPAIVQYLTEHVGGAASGQPLPEIDVRHDAGIHNAVEGLEDRIARHPANRVVVVVRGFEHYVHGFSDEPTRLYASHNLNQEISESYRRERPLQVPPGKKVILIIHIGYSLGENVSRTAIQSALRSQFKDGIVLIDAPT